MRDLRPRWATGKALTRSLLFGRPVGLSMYFARALSRAGGQAKLRARKKGARSTALRPDSVAITNAHLVASGKEALR